MKTDSVPDAQMSIADGIISETDAVIVETPEIYEKCITCKDLGIHCKGPKLNNMKTIANVREYHRRLKKYRGISLRQIYVLTGSEISDGAVRDYFGHGTQDFRWTTVAAIDNALIYLCGGCAIPDLPVCPASSSEHREQIDCEINKRIQAEEKCEALQAQIAELAEKHLDQLGNLQAVNQERVDWLKADINLWRRFSFALLGVLLIALATMLLFHV